MNWSRTVAITFLVNLWPMPASFLLIMAFSNSFFSYLGIFLIITPDKSLVAKKSSIWWVSAISRISLNLLDMLMNHRCFSIKGSGQMPSANRSLVLRASRISGLAKISLRVVIASVKVLAMCTQSLAAPDKQSFFNLSSFSPCDLLPSASIYSVNCLSKVKKSIFSL